MLTKYALAAVVDSAVFNGAGIYASGRRLAREFTVKERNIEFKAVLAYEPKK